MSDTDIIARFDKIDGALARLEARNADVDGDPEIKAGPFTIHGAKAMLYGTLIAVAGLAAWVLVKLEAIRAGMPDAAAIGTNVVNQLIGQ